MVKFYAGLLLIGRVQNLQIQQERPNHVMLIKWAILGDDVSMVELGPRIFFQ